MSEFLSRELLVGALAVAGAAMALLAALGLHRFGDPYQRLHGGGMAALGVALVVVAALVGHGGVRAPELLTLLFVLLSSPTGSHIMTKAMYDAGLRPWEEREGRRAERERRRRRRR